MSIRLGQGGQVACVARSDILIVVVRAAIIGRAVQIVGLGVIGRLDVRPSSGIGEQHLGQLAGAIALVDGIEAPMLGKQGGENAVGWFMRHLPVSSVGFSVSGDESCLGSPVMFLQRPAMGGPRYELRCPLPSLVLVGGHAKRFLPDLWPHGSKGDRRGGQGRFRYSETATKAESADMPISRHRADFLQHGRYPRQLGGYQPKKPDELGAVNDAAALCSFGFQGWHIGHPDAAALAI
ncbi:hypothetical protein LGH82_33140 [Mesorhizobium sp. PAMC28654]|uniref:hypothetical protein n=1 Tax=Mesorhizobium sp. PAMC28654 TaxID=2880934 RepID=UPI001D0A4AA1|nr:hypothetical protein [Mesorhizobium sp. PAMC28654]UDL89827.1 hypothetical protein LGH82_33140 [Mesorhizobium sp. PAMC28654]